MTPTMFVCPTQWKILKDYNEIILVFIINKWEVLLHWRSINVIIGNLIERIN